MSYKAKFSIVRVFFSDIDIDCRNTRNVLTVCFKSNSKWNTLRHRITMKNHK